MVKKTKDAVGFLNSFKPKMIIMQISYCKIYPSSFQTLRIIDLCDKLLQKRVVKKLIVLYSENSKLFELLIFFDHHQRYFVMLHLASHQLEQNFAVLHSIKLLIMYSHMSWC